MTSTLIRPLLWASAAMALAGCTSIGAQKTPVPDVAYSVSPAAQRAEAARVQALRAVPDWGFQGRVAVSRGKEGGSGRIEWSQQGSQYQVQLSAPVTRQSWRLVGDAASGAGRLEGLQGGTREGADAQQLLLEATGWDVPVAQLPDWSRGLVLASAGEAGVQRDAEGRPRRLQQAGWDVQYLEWTPAGPDEPMRPRRVEASRGDAKVRLVIDQWDPIVP